jgi:reverse gyrase
LNVAVAKATIKSQTGATITVEGTPEEVSAVIATYEKTSQVVHAKQAVTHAKAEKKADKKRASAADLIVEMREEGFFDRPKTLGEIGSALEERGFLYPVTSLSGVVLGLLKKRELRRKKQDGKWVYGK